MPEYTAIAVTMNLTVTLMAIPLVLVWIYAMRKRK